MIPYHPEEDAARVLLAGGGELVRRGLNDVLQSDARIAVVGEVDALDELAEATLELAPDVVLLGLDGEDAASGLAALRQTARVAPPARTIVLLERDAVGDALGAVRAGARGALARTASAEALLDAIYVVLEGGAALDPMLATALFEQLALEQEPPVVDGFEARLDMGTLSALSRREQDVLRALAQGYRNKEIAVRLGVSVGTVKTHLRHIFRKLHVGDRTGAVLAAFQMRVPEAA